MSETSLPPPQDQNGNQSSAIENAMDRVMGVAAVAASSDIGSSSRASSTFWPSPTWQGPKSGFYFGTGSYGTGYYRDDAYARDHPSAQEGKSSTIVRLQDVPSDSENQHRHRDNQHRSGEELLQMAEEQQLQQQQQWLIDPKIHSTSSSLSQLRPSQTTSLLFLDGHHPGMIQQASQSLSKWYKQNVKQRVEFANDPHLYMDSEVLLQQSIVVWKSLAAQPQYLSSLLLETPPTKIDTNRRMVVTKPTNTHSVLSILQQLLLHENPDIAVSVISVFSEWLDIQVIEDYDPDETNYDHDENDNHPPPTPTRDNVASGIFQLAYWLVVDSRNHHHSGGGIETSSSSHYHDGFSAWQCILHNLGRLSIRDDEADISNNDNGGGDDDDDDENGNPNNEDFQGVQAILNLTDQLLELDLLRLAAATTNNDNDNNSHGNTIPPSWVPVMMQDAATAGSTTTTTITTTSCSLVSWLLGTLQNTTNTTIAQKTTTMMDCDNHPLLGKCLELLSSLAQRDEAYVSHPDWTHLSRFASMFDDDDDDGKSGDNHNNTSRKKQKKNPHTEEEQLEEDSTFLNGIEILLQLMAPYRKRNPNTDAQLEWLENACLSLASALALSPAKHLPYFLEAQGIELILRCLKEQVHAGGIGLKLLDFNLTSGSRDGDAHYVDSLARRACEQLVEAGGFKYIFPIFAGRSLPQRAQIGEPPVLSSSQPPTIPAAKKRLEREWNQTMQDQIIRILYALSRYLTDASPHDAKARFLSKFVESNCAKCNRLVQLLLYYDQKVRQAEYRFYRSVDEEDDDNDDDINNETRALQAKLQGGGDLFYNLCAIGAFCCVGSKRCHERFVELLASHQSGLTLIQTGLQEFYNVLEDGSQKDQIQAYLKLLFSVE